MTVLQQLALSKALAMLKGAGAQYIVRMPDGAEHVLGDLKLAPPEPEVKPRTRKPRVPVGTYKNIYESYLKDLEVGSVALVPTEGVDGRALQSACTAWCNTRWGIGACMSHRTETHVEVMRVA